MSKLKAILNLRAIHELKDHVIVNKSNSKNQQLFCYRKYIMNILRLTCNDTKSFKSNYMCLIAVDHIEIVTSQLQ